MIPPPMRHDAAGPTSESDVADDSDAYGIGIARGALSLRQWHLPSDDVSAPTLASTRPVDPPRPRRLGPIVVAVVMALAVSTLILAAAMRQ